MSSIVPCIKIGNVLRYTILCFKPLMMSILKFMRKLNMQHVVKSFRKQMVGYNVFEVALLLKILY